MRLTATRFPPIGNHGHVDKTKSNIPKESGDDEWRKELETTAQRDFADRPSDHVGQANGDFHTGSHFALGNDNEELDSTYRIDYKKRMAEMARQKQAASKYDPCCNITYPHR